MRTFKSNDFKTTYGYFELYESGSGWAEGAFSRPSGNIKVAIYSAAF